MRTVWSRAGAKSSSRRVSVLYRRIEVTGYESRGNRARSGRQGAAHLGRAAAAVRLDLKFAVHFAEVERNLRVSGGRRDLLNHAFNRRPQSIRIGRPFAQVL